MWSAIRPSCFLLTTSSIMRTKGIQTSRSAAPHAERLAGLTAAADSAAEEEEDLAAAAAAAVDSVDLERCIQQSAPSAARTQRCPSDLAATDPSTAATATVSSATGAEQAERAEAEDLLSATKSAGLSAIKAAGFKKPQP